MRRVLPWMVLVLSLAPALAPLLAPAPSRPDPAPAEGRLALKGAGGAGGGALVDLPAAPYFSYETALADAAWQADTDGLAGFASGADERLHLVMLRVHADADDAFGAAPLEPPAAVEDADTVALLMAASQQLLGALALAPHAAAHAPAVTDLRNALDPGAAVAAVSEFHVDVAAMPGWLRQATWAVMLTALGALALRALAPAAPALFTRLDPERALRHGRRAVLHDLIRDEPGLSLAELRRRTGLAHGSAQHHLRMLEGHTLVRSHVVGRQRRYFPAGPKADPQALLADGPRRILETLISAPMTTAAVASRMGRSVQTVWLQLDALRDHGLVTTQKQGRRMAWRAKVAP